MSETTNLELKQKLLEECKRLQQNQIHNAKSAMDEAQESANEQQGSMEDKFESFREACQIQRDMFAKQLDEAMTAMTVLKRVVVHKQNRDVTLGSVVITDSQKFFISISLGELTVDGEKYFAISTLSPLYKAMAGKKVDESFTFRTTNYKILEIL
jgi:transcription elongation GreA/GreB family factor